MRVGQDAPPENDGLNREEVERGAENSIFNCSFEKLSTFWLGKLERSSPLRM
jgi:hypothetical protein